MTTTYLDDHRDPSTSRDPGAARRKRRRELARFLRAKRSQVPPADVGLPPGGGRRTPGRRREEGALLSSVGVTWYTWLEQGRAINPSDDVLRSIARTLGLTPPETTYLLALASDPAPVPPTPGPVDGPDPVRALCQNLDPVPAMVMDQFWDLQCWNGAADGLFNISSLPPNDRNGALIAFSQPSRLMLADWPAHAQRIIGELQAASADLLGDQRFCRVLRRLRTDHPDFDTLWEGREIHERAGSGKVFRHPVIGELHLDQIVLEPTGAPGLQLVVLQPEGDSATLARLAELSRREPDRRGPERSHALATA